MPIIRKLVVKSWFTYFSGSFLTLTLLLTIANLITGFLRLNVTPMEVIFNHILEMPSHLKLLTPVSCLAASLFSTNKLKNTSELTAIFASGYSRKDYAFDVILCALTVAFLQFLTSSFLQPYAKSKRDLLITNSETKFRNLKAKGLMSSTISSGKMWFKSENTLMSFSTYDKKNSILYDLSVYTLDNDKVTDIEYTPKATFVGGIWMGSNVKILNSLNQENFSIPNYKNASAIKIRQTPKDFNQIESDITTLNLFFLWQYIYKLYKNGININEYLVLFLESFSTSLICIVFSLFALSGIFSPNRRNNKFGQTVALTLFFIIVYWLISSYFIELGKSSKLHPILATFTVPVLFILYTGNFFYKNRKLT